GKKMKSTPQTARRTSERISPEQPTSASKKKEIQVELVDVEKAKGGEEKDAVDEPVKEDEMVDTEAAKETADLSTPKDDGCESTEGAETAVEEGTKVAVEEGAEEAAPDEMVEDEDGAEKAPAAGTSIHSAHPVETCYFPVHMPILAAPTTPAAGAPRFWHFCTQAGCEYKVKKRSHLNKHHANVHGI
ncbi:hypothetical protein TrRE_jg4097, partial [Triparma retinervis]